MGLLVQKFPSCSCATVTKFSNPLPMYSVTLFSLVCWQTVRVVLFCWCIVGSVSCSHHQLNVVLHNPSGASALPSLISYFISAGTLCFLSWRTVRNFYPLNMLMVLLGSSPYNRMLRRRGWLFWWLRMRFVWGLRKSSDASQPVNL